MHQLIEQGSVAQIVTLQAGDSTVVTETMPAAIQHVIAQHTTLLQEPEGMPPVRAFDHQITGVVAVQKHPYYYAPTQKDELG
jgi:hypothetical protein